MDLGYSYYFTTIKLLLPDTVIFSNADSKIIYDNLNEYVIHPILEKKNKINDSISLVEDRIRISKENIIKNKICKN